MFMFMFMLVLVLVLMLMLMFMFMLMLMLVFMFMSTCTTITAEGPGAGVNMYECIGAGSDAITNNMWEAWYGCPSVRLQLDGGTMYTPQYLVTVDNVHTACCTA